MVRHPEGHTTHAFNLLLPWYYMVSLFVLNAPPGTKDAFVN
jgi:hypothetical protein